MRIGIDARFFGGEQSKGLGRYTQKLVEFLARHDKENEYVIFLQEEGFHKWRNSWLADVENFTPVLAPYQWYTFAEQIFMPRKIRKAKVDLMHFPHFNVPLLFRRKFVATVHDLIIIHFPTERATTLGPYLYKIKHFAGQLVMRHAVKNSEHVITVSEFSKKDIAEYYSVDPSHITVTYEAADFGNHVCEHGEEDAVTAKYDIDAPYLLYVGNAYPHKNLEILIETARELKDTNSPYKIVLVGKADYFYKRLQQEAWAKDIEDRVIFTGFVPDADLPCLYAEAHAYVFPSRYEGFGLPPLEAMSFGTPVIAANTSCLPEILGEGAMYFDYKSVSGIINSVHELENPAKREELVESGYQQVQKYSWEKMMKETLRVYEQIKTHKEGKK